MALQPSRLGCSALSSMRMLWAKCQLVQRARRPRPLPPTAPLMGLSREACAVIGSNQHPPGMRHASGASAKVPDPLCNLAKALACLRPEEAGKPLCKVACPGLGQLLKGGIFFFLLFPRDLTALLVCGPWGGGGRGVGGNLCKSLCQKSASVCSGVCTPSLATGFSAKVSLFF